MKLKAPGKAAANTRGVVPWFQFAYGSGPQPGAMPYALESEWLAWHPLIGSGVGVQGVYTAFAPQAYQGVPVSWVTGLTGVVHGQSALQPLSNPYQTGSA